MPPAGLDQVQRAHRVGVEIVKGNRRGPIMRGLGSGVDQAVRAQFPDQAFGPRAVTDIQFVMREAGHRLLQMPLNPTRVPRGAEKHGSLVIVQSVNLKSPTSEVGADLRAD
jgi:hypothetical protein